MRDPFPPTPNDTAEGNVLTRTIGKARCSGGRQMGQRSLDRSHDRREPPMQGVQDGLKQG